jgi:hypothetical protein
MNTQQYKGSAGAGLLDVSRGPSQAIWADCPILELMAGVTDGIHIFDDFTNGPRVAAGAEASYAGYGGGYRGFADTGGSVVDGNEVGGTLVLSSDGDNEGASFRTSVASFQIARTMGKLWFEARLKTDSIGDTRHGIFIGMMADAALTAVLPITAGGAIADVNIVGFHRLENDGDKFDTIYKADGVTQVTVEADATAVVADTFIKLGFVFDPKTAVLTFYRNGVKLANTYTVPTAAGTDFPNDVRLGLVIAVLNATATSPGAAEIDWWRCAQLSVAG